MSITETIGLKASLFAFALTGAGALALAAPPNGQAPDAGIQSTHATQALPAALRPVFYQTLAEDAGPAYNVNAKGCATLTSGKLTGCFDVTGAHFNSKGATPLALHLVSYGRGETLTPVSPVRPAITGNQVSYTHGALSEWWRVLPVGFEQGFTLAKRPKGNGELTLALSAAGMAKQDNGALAWGKLRYGGLVVTDVNGEVVPAKLKSEGDHILIAVNDAHAAYPLTVDPLVWIEQKVTASDGLAGDDFGWPVVISGNIAFIGAPYATVNGNTEQGAAYVFTESDGTWVQAQKLTASDGEANDVFGYSVALDGTTALIGASFATVNGSSGQGAVYVFTRSNGNWSQTTKLTASDGAANAQFGIAVALDGSSAFIGANHASVDGNNAEGEAYVFTGSGSNWTQTQELTASDGAAFYFFGWAIALDGTTAFIAAPDGGSEGQGAVYVFTESNGTWSQAQELIASDGAAMDSFGYAVAASGPAALIGSAFATVNGQPQEGAVYVFSNSDGTWAQVQKLTASDGGAFGNFGAAVSLVGSTAFIGAAGEDAAYEFTASNGVWSQAQEFMSNSAEYDGFGYHVAFDGMTALIGASFSTVNGNAGQGAAYFYGEGDLGLNVSAPETVGQGQNYVSQTIATNNASAASPAVSATITVPAAASFVSASATQGSCSEASGVVTCDFGAISGNAGTATANVTLKATGSSGTTIENTASVAKATP
ncbi:MAG: FG-GAP repeat protein, partial [Gammaproteobacteria bacterium]